ncbi:hypothetical protein [Serratia phage vB_SspM_LC53]|nr:hypothetical protein [Serratia phage vB_SspM_LC53]
MKLEMTLEQYQEAMEKAKKEGVIMTLEKLRDGFQESYNEMTSGFFSRMGREANIEIVRRLIHSLDLSIIVAKKS